MEVAFSPLFSKRRSYGFPFKKNKYGFLYIYVFPAAKNLREMAMIMTVMINLPELQKICIAATSRVHIRSHKLSSDCRNVLTALALVVLGLLLRCWALNCWSFSFYFFSSFSVFTVAWLPELLRDFTTMRQSCALVGKNCDDLAELLECPRTSAGWKDRSYPQLVTLKKPQRAQRSKAQETWS